jgi:hypothetical protein
MAYPRTAPTNPEIVPNDSVSKVASLSHDKSKIMVVADGLLVMGGSRNRRLLWQL